MKKTYIHLCLMLFAWLGSAIMAYAQETQYIRVEEESNIRYGNRVGGVHFFKGEILEVAEDHEKGKVVKWADSTLLVPYGANSNMTVNYTKISETEPGNTATMAQQFETVRSGIQESLRLNGDVLVMDLTALDETLGKPIRIDISNNATAKLSAEKSRKVERGIENFSFPLRVVPAGYPTFWINEADLTGDSAQPVASETPPAQTSTESALVKGERESGGLVTEENHLMDWLPWALFGLAMVLAAFFAYPFFAGKNKAHQDKLLQNQQDILDILKGGSVATTAGVASQNASSAGAGVNDMQQRLDKLEQEANASRQALAEEQKKHTDLQTKFDAMMEEGSTKLSAAAASIGMFRERVLLFKDNEAGSFAENHRKVIQDSLAAYDDLQALLMQAAGNEAYTAEANVLAAILTRDNVSEKVNKLRQYDVELHRLGETGVWTRQEEVKKLRGQDSTDEKVGLIRRHLVTQALAPFLNQLLIMIEEAGHLKEITSKDNELTGKAADLLNRGQELRKQAQQLIALSIDHVSLFANMNDYSKIGAVRKTPAPYLMGVDLPSHHIRQVVEYGMSYGDIDKKTEVILQE